MHRRRVLAALTPLLTGCFGGSAVSRTETPDGESTAGATPEPTDTPTPTPAPTDTPTPTPEGPTAAEAEAARHIETARDRIETAVDEYADGGDLTDVRADAEGFVPGDVYAVLVRANSAVSRAAALAATDEQETTAARLEGVVAFLTRATAAQENVIEGHAALVAARDALDDEVTDLVDTRVDEVDTARENADRALSNLTSDTDASDVEAVDALDDGDYETKRDQFDAATDALDDAMGEVSNFADGIDLLTAARSRGENGDEDAAAEDAADAWERLDDVASAFGDILDDLPDEASAFEDLFVSYQDLADEKAADAEDVQNDYE